MTDETEQTEKLFKEAVRTHRSGAEERAAELYVKVLAHSPSHMGSVHNLAYICKAHGRHPEAAELFARLSRLQPESQSAMLEAGYCHFVSGNYARALEFFGKVDREKLRAFTPYFEEVRGYAQKRLAGEKEARVRVAGHELRFLLSGAAVGSEMFLAAGRFPDGEEIDRLIEWIDQPRVIVDVGANIGVYTVALAKIFPSATIIPFEPDAAVTEVLRKNVALNGLENVALDHLGKAVGAAASRGRLVRDPAGDSVYSRVELSAEGDVEVVRLDDLGLADVDLMKIDVEGAEFDVLDGAAELLAGQPALLLEITEQSYVKLVSFLTRYRYFIAFSVPREEYANYFLKPALCRVDGLPGKTRA